MSAVVEPPYYILFSQSPLASPNAVPGAPSSSLGHPMIQYHYADDSPLSLLPNTPDEHVLVLDYDPTTGALTAPTVRSTSKNMAVTGLKIAEAPGAAAADEGCDIKKNDRMYILETTTCEDRSDIEASDRQTPQAVLSQFKQRNAILRRALIYPNTSASPSTTDTKLSYSPTQSVPLHASALHP